MDAFAASAATAVATAQNVAQLGLRRSIEAAEAERGRWARELHDDTLQELAALKIGLASARRATDPAVVSAVLDDAVAQIDSTIRDLRAIINDLRPAALDALGVVPAVEALVERAKGRAAVEISRRADLAFEAGRSSRAARAGDRARRLPAGAGGADERRAARRCGPHPHRHGRARRPAHDHGPRRRGAASIPSTRMPVSA